MVFRDQQLHDSRPPTFTSTPFFPRKKTASKPDYKFDPPNYHQGGVGPWLAQHRTFFAPDRSTFGPKTALDIGTFKGRNLPLLFESFDRVIGTDVKGAKDALNICRQRFPEADLRITPFDSFPTIGDESIHGGFAHRYLHHAQNVDQVWTFIRELHRVLAPKSRYMVTTRAAKPSMDQKAQEPKRYTTQMPTGKTRTDLYFTLDSLSMFAHFFRIIRIDRFCEWESYLVDGKSVKVENPYWSVQLYRS